MLSNLASYLGYQPAPPEQEPEAEERVNLCAVEEDEWLLVERLETEPSVSEAVGTSPSTLPGARSSMQESWYLTPPPSFSRGSVHVATSPLENLLIEHPSMSVYQKNTKRGRRKAGKSSGSASEEDSRVLTPCEEGQLKSEKFEKLRNKYSKKTSVKRPPASSSDDALSLPSASEDEEQKEVKMKNFVKSPRRSLGSLKGRVKAPSLRRTDASSSDEMISIPSNNEDDGPTIGSLAIQPPRKLYSDVLRAKPKPAAVPAQPAETGEVSSIPSDSCISPLEPAPSIPAPALVEEDGLMLVEEPLVERDRRRPLPATSGMQRQNFLNRSAQKLEQRKICELAKRSTMGRNNKAREINSRNKRQRRSDMMQRHSGVNNNRKCY